MLAENYTYTVTACGAGVEIVLSSNDGVRTKKFTLASASVDGVTAHMESLTDDLCDGFFRSAERQKKEKKAKASG